MADILASKHGTGADGAPGLRLTMRDGSTWFHPFNGRAPVCERQPEGGRANG